MSVVANPREFNNAMDRFEKRFEQMFRERMRKLVTEGMRRLIAKTPVNTGQAVMNYVATGGAPYSGPVKEAGEPVEPTNQLALGAEKLRSQAAQVATATVKSVDFSNPYQTFYITNRAPHIAGLEAGALPYEPFQQRSPNGMFGVTVMELLQYLNSGKI